MVTDEQIQEAFKGTKFGLAIDTNVTLKKKLIAETVFKILCDYKAGHTVTCILAELGMTTYYGTKPVKQARRWAYNVILGR